MNFIRFRKSNQDFYIVCASLLLVLSLLAGCAQQPVGEPTIQNEVAQQEFTDTPPAATATTAPTSTPEPTATPEPQGPFIAFVSNRGGEQDSRKLYVMNLGSGEISLVETGFNNVALPRWSPDGQKILFVVPGDWNLYTVRPDGTELTQVTDFRSNNADWSPDGNSLVFQSDHAGEPENVPDIYTMKLDGSDLKKIVEDIQVADFGPRWSPVGNMITFLSAKTGHPEIYVINPDGSERKQVTESGSTVISQDVSPDGSRVAFSYPRGKTFTDLYTLDISGKVDTVIRLTKDDSLKDAPVWTPDGEQIVYYGNKDGPFDIWIINKDGSGAENLTQDDYYDAYPDYWAP